MKDFRVGEKIKPEFLRHLKTKLHGAVFVKRLKPKVTVEIRNLSYGGVKDVVNKVVSVRIICK